MTFGIVLQRSVYFACIFRQCVVKFETRWLSMLSRCHLKNEKKNCRTVTAASTHNFRIIQASLKKIILKYIKKVKVEQQNKID